MQLFKEKTMWKKKLDKIKLEINCDSCLITLNKDKEIQLILAKLFQLGLGVECNVQERQQNIVNSRPQSEANSAFMSRHVLGQFGSSAELCVAHNKFGTQYKNMQNATSTLNHMGTAHVVFDDVTCACTYTTCLFCAHNYFGNTCISWAWEWNVMFKKDRKFQATGWMEQI